LLEGEQLLGVDGLVDGDGVLLEMGDLVKLFEAVDDEAGGGEAVSAGVAGGTGLPWGVRGPVLLAALARLAASCLSDVGMMRWSFLAPEIAGGGRESCGCLGIDPASGGWERSYFLKKGCDR